MYEFTKIERANYPLARRGNSIGLECVLELDDFRPLKESSFRVAIEGIHKYNVYP